MGKAWNDFRSIRKTRKPHLCVSCGRTIPPGMKAWNFAGEYEGDFQNWYLCEYCMHYVYPNIASEEIDVYNELYTYLEDTYAACPECGHLWSDPKILRNKDDHCLYTLLYGCGHTLELHIPFNL